MILRGGVYGDTVHDVWATNKYIEYTYRMTHTPTHTHTPNILLIKQNVRDWWWFLLQVRAHSVLFNDLSNYYPKYKWIAHLCCVIVLRFQCDDLKLYNLQTIVYMLLIYGEWLSLNAGPRKHKCHSTNTKYDTDDPAQNFSAAHPSIHHPHQSRGSASHAWLHETLDWHLIIPIYSLGIALSTKNNYIVFVCTQLLYTRIYERTTPVYICLLYVFY